MIPIRRSAKTVAFAWVMAVAVAGPTSAQVFSCADTTKAILGGFVGQWELTASFRGDSGKWETSAAQSVIAPDMGGCVLSEHFTGTRYGAPYEFQATWGANGGNPRVQRTFVHSQHGIIGVWAGNFVGDTLVLEHSALVRGDTIVERHVFSRPGAGGFFFESRRSADHGQSWIATWRARYRRGLRARARRDPEGCRGPRCSLSIRTL